MKKAADFVRNLRLSEIEENALNKAKDCILDFIGAVLAGINLRSAEIAINVAKSFEKSGQATLWPLKQKVSCPSAAFVHGTVGTALDIDDGHRMARGHPGGVVIPAALSIAERNQNTGKELLEAIICGYEVGIRSGHILRVMNPNIASLASGRWGSTGAAAAVAKLLNLNIEEIEQALAVSATFAPVAPATDDLEKSGIMPMTKLSSGWGAAVGIWSAFLAQQGFTGVTSTIDFSLGSLPQFGKSFEIKNVYFKPYPSCRWTHPAIEGVMQLMKEHSELNKDTIKRIIVRTFRDATRLKEPHPQTVESAQYSIPFLVGVIVVCGQVSHKQITEEKLSDPDILRIAEKVEVVHDPDIDSCFPMMAPSEIEIENVLEKSYRTRIDRPKGDYLNPMSVKEFIDKFRLLAAESISLEASEMVIESVGNLEKLASVKELIDILLTTRLNNKISKKISQKN